MSRGSYQRRVWITVLQHNEGYKWQYAGLLQFAGCTPGKLLEQMIHEKLKLKEATIKSKNRPEYTRKQAKVNAVDRDYGLHAIEAAERVYEFENTESSMIQKYQVSTNDNSVVLANFSPSIQCLKIYFSLPPKLTLKFFKTSRFPSWKNSLRAVYYLHLWLTLCGQLRKL